MSLHHVPFGLSITDNRLVDVADVKRGKQCGCICPSCQLPLLARQGDINQWHFAHTHRQHAEIENSCDFSFFVSVRMMAKQIMTPEITLDLPPYHSSVNQTAHGQTFTSQVNITHASTITLKDAKLDALLAGCMFDVVACIGQFSFAVYFSHPNRPLPLQLKQLSSQQFGAMEIRLDSLYELFKQADSAERQQDLLNAFLQHNVNAKKWLFHPRQVGLLQLAKRQLNERIAQAKPKQYNNRKPKPFKQNRKVKPDLLTNTLSQNMALSSKLPAIKRQTATYECVLCKCQWQVDLPNTPNCPKCHTHLYARECV